MADQWTDREIMSFIHETRQFLELLSRNLHLLQSTLTRKYIYLGPINPLTIHNLPDKISKENFEFVNIRGTRQMSKNNAD